MNANDLNNVAKRYKEEMMQLYRKSSGISGTKSAAEQNGGIMGMGAGMSGTPVHTQRTAANGASAAAVTAPAASASMTRDAAGTPVPGVPGASFYGAAENMQTDNSCKSYPPVNMPPQHTMHCDCRFPTAESIINSIANTPMTLPATSDNAVAQADTSAAVQTKTVQAETLAADTGETHLRSIIINSSPDSATYSMPAQSDAEGEILPDFALPADIPADSDEAVPSTARFYPSQSWIALTGDNAWGFLQFEVFTSGGDIPLQGAVVIVKKRIATGIGLLRLLFTGRNGLTPTIALPAPGIMQPTADAVQPFSTYEVTVIARGYYTLRNIQVPVYAGSKLVQPIDMIPIRSIVPQPRTDSSDISLG